MNIALLYHLQLVLSWECSFAYPCKKMINMTNYIKYPHCDKIHRRDNNMATIYTYASAIFGGLLCNEVEEIIISFKI